MMRNGAWYDWSNCRWASQVIIAAATKVFPEDIVDLDSLRFFLKPPWVLDHAVCDMGSLHVNGGLLVPARGPCSPTTRKRRPLRVDCANCRGGGVIPWLFPP